MTPKTRAYTRLNVFYESQLIPDSEAIWHQREVYDIPQFLSTVGGFIFCMLQIGWFLSYTNARQSFLIEMIEKSYDEADGNRISAFPLKGETRRLKRSEKCYLFLGSCLPCCCCCCGKTQRIKSYLSQGETRINDHLDISNVI